MIGKLKDITFTRSGEQIVSFSTKSDFTEAFDTLKDFDVDVEIKRHRQKRSLDANAFCWVLCEKLADKLADEDVKQTKEEIYRTAIREVGVYKDFPNLSQDEAKTLRTAWGLLGTGWVTEQVDFSQDGMKVKIRCYYGSSQYNTKQMSRLIDFLVEECKENGIPTETPEQIEKIKSLWAQPPQKGYKP
jgi:hypothetical protein